MVDNTSAIQEATTNRHRCKNKQIMMINYNDISDICLIASSSRDNAIIIEKILFEMKDNSNIGFDCDVSIPDSLFYIFNNKDFNNLQSNKRKKSFDRLISFINKGC